MLNKFLLNEKLNNYVFLHNFLQMINVMLEEGIDIEFLPLSRTFI